MEKFDSLVEYADPMWKYYDLADKEYPGRAKIGDHWYRIAMFRHDELCLEMVGCLDSGLL